MVKTLERDRYALCEKHVIVPFCCSHQMYRYLAGCFGLISCRHYLIFSAQSGAALPIANVLARIFSASFNFVINRRFVFCAQAEKLLPAMIRYFLLAMTVLVMNTLMLTGLVEYCGVHPYFAKILTEVALFLCSWSLQKWFVFRKSGTARPECQNGGENTPSL